uniref:AAA+ ATPase domain-containing protein n=1 Tax=viral metagenome TaxID=1070528 RepID=A0A6C0KLZ0_9ZZZZ
MSLNIHENIKEKLKYFHKIKKIPNIIFNGPSGSGKSTLVNEFISLIYDGNKSKIKDFVMYVNCAHGKGIKFIREELKFFAKTHIISNGGDIFKSVVLLNGDKLTMDAQSALRRCIELFSHNTRFFIIVEDKYKLLRPILSRFCEIYVSEPELNGKSINLYKYQLEETFKLSSIKNQRIDWLKKEIQKLRVNMETISEENIQEFIIKLYEKAYNSLDLILLIEDGSIFLKETKRYELLIAFNKIRKEFRNEKLLMFFIINFTFLDKEAYLENISFM